MPAWVATLPAVVRDAIVRGDFEQIPPQYRTVIREYLRWLQTEAEEGGSSR